MPTGGEGGASQKQLLKSAQARLNEFSEKLRNTVSVDLSAQVTVLSNLGTAISLSTLIQARPSHDFMPVQTLAVNLLGLCSTYSSYECDALSLLASVPLLKLKGGCACVRACVSVCHRTSVRKVQRTL